MADFSRSKSKVPRPITPVRSSTEKNSTRKQLVPPTIGIHIDNTGPRPSTTLSITQQRKSRSGEINTPTSPNQQRASSTSPSRNVNWASDASNPYRQSLARSPIRSQASVPVNNHSPSQAVRPSVKSGSLGSQTQRSVPSSKRLLEGQGYGNRFSPGAPSQNPSNGPGIKTTASSQVQTNLTKNKLSLPQANPIGNSPKRAVTIPIGPDPSRIYTGSKHKLLNPNYQGSANSADTSIAEIAVKSSKSATSKVKAGDAGRQQVITLPDSSDDEPSDIIEIEVVSTTKSKPTIAQRLIQSISQKTDETEPAPAESAKSQHFSQNMHRNRNATNLQRRSFTIPRQALLGSKNILPPPTQSSALLAVNPFPGSSFPHPIAVPYFPPLDPAANSRLFSTGVSLSLSRASEPPHSSTNSPFEAMQVDGDESCENISIPEQVRNKLRKVRKWEFTTLGRLYQDSRHHGTRTMDGGLKFTVLSYNVLAPTLLSEHSNQLYKEVQPECLEWSQRHDRFLTELSEFGYPDILCLQEVEATLYRKSYEVPLTKHGYKGIFKKRTGDKVDGCAIFWKDSLFTYIGNLSVEYSQPHVPLLDRDNIALLVKLQSKIGKRPKLVVATTHLLFNPKRNDVKLAQVQVILTELDRFAFSGFNNRGETVYHPMILTGDFNTEPHSSIVRLLTDGELQYANENGGRPKLLVRKGLNDFLPFHVGISDQCQHYRVVLERYNQWNVQRRNVFELDAKQQHKLTNLFSSEYSQVINENEMSDAAVLHENKKVVVEVDPETHVAILTDIYNHGAPCTFGAGEISHKLRFSDIYQPRLDRSTENLHDYIATTRQGHWVCVDYIFYSKLWNQEFGRRIEGNLKLLKRLGLPTKSQCKDLGYLPSFAVSSDHFPLLAEFIIK